MTVLQQNLPEFRTLYKIYIKLSFYKYEYKWISFREANNMLQIIW